MARCLVIGGNGFIGSHLVDALAADGHEVVAFDRFSAGARYSSASVEMHAGDFLNVADLEAAVDDTEYLFHFLSLTTPATAESDPTLDIRTNIAQSVELFRIAAKRRARRVFFASTGGAIYGENGRTMQREVDPTAPISPYAIGKLTLENYLRFFHRTTGLASTTLRISNPYGPRQPGNRKQGLIPIALRRVLTGRPVTIYGDGSMTRDYIYVDDLVQRISRLVYKQPKHALYNLGSGIATSTNEVIQAIARVTGIEPEIERVPAPSSFVQDVVLSSQRYEREFLTEHRLTPIDDGISATWEAMRHER